MSVNLYNESPFGDTPVVLNDLTVLSSLTITDAVLTLNQYDNTTIGFSTNQLYVKDNGITTNKIADINVTDAKIDSVSGSKIISTSNISCNRITVNEAFLNTIYGNKSGSSGNLSFLGYNIINFIDASTFNFAGTSFNLSDLSAILNVNNIRSYTTNSNLNLSGNGSGIVNVNDNLNVTGSTTSVGLISDTLTSKTSNTNLTITANGSGIVSINNLLNITQQLIIGSSVDNNASLTIVPNLVLGSYQWMRLQNPSGTVIWILSNADTDYSLKFQYGAITDNVLVMKKSGNISIGANLDTHKLYVSGTTRITGIVTMDSDLNVTGDITKKQYFLEYSNTVAQSITTGSATVVNWNSQIVRTNLNAPSSDVFTPNKAGYYNICYTVYFDPAANGIRQAWIRFNGSDSNRYAQVSMPGVSADTQVLTGSFIVKFNGTTDTFAIACYQTSGGSINTGSAASGGRNRLCCHYLHE